MEIEAENTAKGQEHQTEIKDRKQLIPFASNQNVKAIAQRPKLAQLIFYLEKHGISSQIDLRRALNISDGGIWSYTHKLLMTGFPIVKIRKAENQIDKRMTYYDLQRPDPMSSLLSDQEFAQEERRFKNMLKELRVWFEYHALEKFENYLPVYEWVDVESLRRDRGFLDLIEEWGFTFDKALDLLVANGVVYVQKKEEQVVSIKRCFDNYGKRIGRDEIDELKQTLQEAISDRKFTKSEKDVIDEAFRDLFEEGMSLKTKRR